MAGESARGHARGGPRGPHRLRARVVPLGVAARLRSLVVLRRLPRPSPLHGRQGPRRCARSHRRPRLRDLPRRCQAPDGLRVRVPPVDAAAAGFSPVLLLLGRAPPPRPRLRLRARRRGAWPIPSRAGLPRGLRRHGRRRLHAARAQLRARALRRRRSQCLHRPAVHAAVPLQVCVDAAVEGVPPAPQQWAARRGHEASRHG
mmetsp:Transcript_12233/g.34619  ORF Transcript_12233/g.34619 Transcript_12233/m.34619 type:complete len:202 (+) Transcript_12233:1542-2147(+)